MKRFLMTLAIAVLLLSACAPIALPPAPTPTSTPTANDSGLANPSATLCQERGYTYEIRTNSDGSQGGVCKFPDGSECDGWAYFRGECGPADKTLEPQQGEGTSTVVGTPVGSDNKAVQVLRVALAAQKGIAADALAVQQVEMVDWPDSCLGLGGAAEICAAVITPGYRVVVKNGNALSTYRIDLTGEVFRLEQ